MSGRQFGFLAGFLIAWLWAANGFLAALAAVVAGGIGLAVAHLATGEGDVADIVERVTGSRRR